MIKARAGRAQGALLHGGWIGACEEKIQALQTRKAQLAKAVLEGGSSKKLRFDEADLDALFGTTP